MPILTRRNLAFGLFLLYLAVAAPLALVQAWTRVSDGLPHLGEDPETARRRTFGAPYTDAIAGIRRALPPGLAYVLINADDHEEGAPLWVRHDLAPHPAIFFGRLSQLPPNVRRAFPRGSQPVILTFGYKEPPLLVGRKEFLDWFETPGRKGLPGKD
ncbi:MAG TPA: hypothetical protein VMM92_02320, partial [Thermoanaerobaculia bacterium]|nr:hypothetical protein [Thermoanaerobaculia bacterium]